MFNKDSVYAYSIIYLKIDLSCNYPVNPPKIKFIQPNCNFRFHPNLYVDGIICMSILGTWGHTWSPVCRLYDCLLNMKSQIDLTYPIDAEPTYKTTIEYKKLYNINIIYNSLRYLLLDNHHTLKIQEKFVSILDKYFIEIKDEIIDYIYKIKNENIIINKYDNKDFIFKIRNNLDFDELKDLIYRFLN